MTLSKFNIGDVVELKSGGPAMTVDSVRAHASGEKIRCIWWITDRSDYGADLFEPGTLVHYDVDREFSSGETGEG